MKGEGGDLSENLGRNAPERRRRSVSGREHPGESVEVLSFVVGERARRHHALEVWVARFGRKRGTGGEQDRVDTLIDTSHDSQPSEILIETSFSYRNCEI